MNVAELIIAALKRMDVKYIFGIPGGAIEDLNTAIYNNRFITPIVAKHEEGAAFMADGFARVSGELGVCCATSGPGASNLITGLASAYADSIPVLALTGQVATSVFGKGALQEASAEGVDIVSIFRTFTKYSGMLITEERAQYMIQKAIRLATTGLTGPVHLNLPINLMKNTVPAEPMPCSVMANTRLFNGEAIDHAARKLVRARRPLIIAGWGVALSRAAYELRDLARLLRIPVVTSPKGKGVFPESDDLSLGVLGFAGQPEAKEYAIDGDVDVILAVGTSFNEMLTGGWNNKLLPTDELIQIDINVENIGKNYCATIGLPGDARIILLELYRAVEQIMERYDIEIFDRNDLAELKQKHRERDTPPQTREGLYHPRHLIADLQRSCPEDTIYFADMGSIMAWSIRYMKIDIPYSFMMGLGFASMGYAVAAPVGAKLARPQRPVVALVGDGSFQMNGFEVATAVNYQIPVVWVVFNNSMLGMVYHGRKLFTNEIPDGLTSRFKRVDFAKVAEGLGARGITIDKPGGITPELMDEILASGYPTVIDVIIDEEAVPPIHSRIRTVDKLS